MRHCLYCAVRCGTCPIPCTHKLNDEIFVLQKPNIQRSNEIGERSGGSKWTVTHFTSVNFCQFVRGAYSVWHLSSLISVDAIACRARACVCVCDRINAKPFKCKPEHTTLLCIYWDRQRQDNEQQIMHIDLSRATKRNWIEMMKGRGRHARTNRQKLKICLLRT